MAPQLSHAGASDWKSANCSLRAVFGPVSLKRTPARARRAALMSPLLLMFAWPLAAWGVGCRVSGVGGERVAVGSESLRLAVDGFGPFSAGGAFPAITGRGFMDLAVVVIEPAPPGGGTSSFGSAVASAAGSTPMLAS